MHPVRALPIPRPGQRALALFIALALQISFLFLLAEAVLKPSPMVRQLARELTLTLPKLPVRRPAPAPSSAARGVPGIIRPEVTPPASVSPPASALPIVPPSALQGFGQALNNCAPENYANLPEDQKALCTRPGQGVAVQSTPNLMGVPSQVKDPARWANALAHEQSPPWLPCSIAVRTQFGSGPGFDLACLAEEFAAGILTDPMTWPTYETKQLQPEDFYKIQQAYDDWHNAHAKAH